MSESDRGPILIKDNGQLMARTLRVMFHMPNAFDRKLFCKKPEVLLQIRLRKVSKVNTFIVNSVSCLGGSLDALILFELI